MDIEETKTDFLFIQVNCHQMILDIILLFIKMISQFSQYSAPDQPFLGETGQIGRIQYQ